MKFSTFLTRIEWGTAKYTKHILLKSAKLFHYRVKDFSSRTLLGGSLLGPTTFLGYTHFGVPPICVVAPFGVPKKKMIRMWHCPHR